MNETLYWLIFAIRVVIIAMIFHDYGFKAGILAFVYATLTALPKVIA